MLEKIPVKGQWLYGEYDFIAKVEFADITEMNAFERLLRKVINGNTYKLFPVRISAVRDKKSMEVSVIEAIQEGVV